MKILLVLLAAVAALNGRAQETLPPMEGSYVTCPDLSSDVEPIALGAPRKNVSPYHVTYDFDLVADLSSARGISFDYRIDDILPFEGIEVQLKSGEGWYSAKLDRDIDPRLWHRCKLALSDFKSEVKPTDWRKVSRLRLALTFSGDSARSGRVQVDVGNFGLMRSRPDVLVLRSDASTKRGTRGAWTYCEKFLASLKALGVDAEAVSDLDLAADCFANVGLVVLPYNPVVPEDTLSRLEAYVKDGGKLIICGAFPAGVRELLGVRENGFWYASKASKDEAIAGFARIGKGLPGQPEFVEQASWQTALLEPVTEGAGEVIARWAGKDGQPSVRTAILKTPVGFAVGHVWFGPEEGRNRLLASMLADVCPRLAGAADRLKERETLKRRVDRWIATLPSKADERRLMWCHSEKGMRGKDWDASARFLKENNFTDLIVNLAWAGTAYYPSEVYPVNPSVAKDGDMFAACQAACRKYGVRMHMWLVALFLNERIVDKQIVSDYVRAGRVQIGRDLKPFKGEGGLWLCPTHPENRRAIKEALLEAARKGADGVHFDYIRYEGRGGCYCERCHHLFERKLGREVSDWPRDALGDLSDEWLDFRRAAVSSLVRSTAEEVHKLRPEVEVSAAVMRDPGVGGWACQCAQDWPTWCEKGWVDFVCPMDYRNSSELFGDIVAYQRPMAGKAKIYPGLGLTCWADDGGMARRFGEQVLKCREAGYEGWTVFDLNGRGFGKILPKFAPNLLYRAAVAPQETGPVEPARTEQADVPASVPSFVSDLEDSVDAIKKNWKLVFEDEFEGAAGSNFDHSKWHIPGYFRRKEDYARLDGKGHLAIKCDYNPECASTASTNLDATAVWSNAQWKYGYFEARVRFTRNNGWWTAFWLFGESNANPVECGSEIDIFEDYFTRYPEKQNEAKGGIPLDHNLHAYYGPTIKSMSYESRASGSLDDFHTIGCKWTPFEIAVYFDGRLLKRKDGRSPVAFDAFRNNAFAAPLHVVLSGEPMRKWGPRDTTGFVFPEYYLVDSVRVWECPRDDVPSVAFRKRPADGFVEEGTVLSFEAEVKATENVRAVYLFDNGAFVSAKTNAPWTFEVPFSKAAYGGSAFMRPGRQKAPPAWEGLMHSYSLYAQDEKGRVGESDGRVRIIPRSVRKSQPNADGAQRLPGRLDVSRFDEGGANVAHWSIRNTPNVQGRSVRMLHTGEWLRYTVDVGSEGVGSVVVDYRPCCSSAGEVMIVCDGKAVATVRCPPQQSGRRGPKKSSAVCCGIPPGRHELTLVPIGYLTLDGLEFGVLRPSAE